MTKRVFIWVAHPKPASFCAALAEAYQVGAERGGAQVRRADLSQMSFCMSANQESADEQAPLEADLVDWQNGVDWADHLFFIHPYWWGAMPAEAKSVLDRALLPGFGFKHHGQGLAWDKLLKGKTADVLITSDTPPWFDTLVYRKPGRRVMKNQVLGYCGIKTKTIAQFGSVKTATAKKRQAWLERAQRMGVNAAGRGRAGAQP